jgi:hypothetical protein
VSTFAAKTALPFAHVMHATARLRGELRRQIVAEDVMASPDWSTLKVSGPFEAFDRQGRIWFEYLASVECQNLVELLQRRVPA